MTRINCVPVEELCRQHLVAANAAASGICRQGLPKQYLLGSGHVKFFYNKCKWLAERHTQLVIEMQRRVYQCNIINPHEKWLAAIPDWMLGTWQPTTADMELNRKRIKERMPK